MNRDGNTQNATALAFLAQWYAIPDDTPLGYWDEFEALLNAHPMQWRSEDEGEE